MGKRTVWVGPGPKPPISPVRLAPLFANNSRIMAAMDKAAAAKKPSPSLEEKLFAGEVEPGDAEAPADAKAAAAARAAGESDSDSHDSEALAAAAPEGQAAATPKAKGKAAPKGKAKTAPAPKGKAAASKTTASKAAVKPRLKPAKGKAAPKGKAAATAAPKRQASKQLAPPTAAQGKRKAPASVTEDKDVSVKEELKVHYHNLHIFM